MGQYMNPAFDAQPSICFERSINLMISEKPKRSLVVLFYFVFEGAALFFQSERPKASKKS